MRSFCLLLVGVVVGWAASGFDWTRDAVGQDAPALAPQPAEDLQRRVDEIQRSNREAAQRPSAADAITGDRIEVTGPRISASFPGRYSLKVQGTMGYYVIDSLTGRVWYGTGANRPHLIAAELPQN